MDKRAWWGTVHEGAKSWTWLRNWVHTYTHRHINVLISLTMKNNLSLPHVFFHPQFSSVQFSPSVLSYSLRSHELQHFIPPCPSPSPGVHPSRWSHPTISSSVVPFSSHLQSFPALGSFQMSQLFTSGGQSIGASASASVLPMNIQGWFPLGLNGLISFKQCFTWFSPKKRVLIFLWRGALSLTVDPRKIVAKPC